jgi:hypothetical protein
VKRIIVACSLVTACATGVSEGEFSFGDGTPASGPADDPADGDTEATTSGTDGGTGDDESTGGASDYTSTTSTSTSTTGAVTTSGDDGPESTGAMPPDGGGQPMSGMYSHCLDANACAGVGACLQVLDANMNVTDGFCTPLGCQSPNLDCDPSPGGTATPACYPVTANGMPDAVCALDCSGGKTCPTGMICQNLTGGQVCA